MRILFVVQNYPPERGPVRYTSTLSVALARRGHEVHVVTALPHYPEGKPHAGYGRIAPLSSVEQGVHVLRLPVVMASNTQIVRRLFGMVTFATLAMPVAATLGARPDVVVASVPPVPTALAGLCSGWTRGVPVVMLLRDVEPKISFALRGIGDHPWARGVCKLCNSMYGLASRLVVVHSSQRTVLTDSGIPDGKIDTIPHGIDLESFSALASKPTSSPFPRRPGRAVALYCGTLGVAHDVALLVRCFASDVIRALPVDLVLVGHGEQVRECARIVRDYSLDNVILVPPVPLEDVPSVLAHADILVSSYRTTGRFIEGMIGSKFYEYCAAGRPILTIGEGAAADLVALVGNGMKVDAGDIQGLAAALSLLTNSPDRSSAMGALGRAYAGQHFAIDARVEQWEQLLHRLAYYSDKTGRSATAGTGAPAERRRTREPSSTRAC